VFSISFLFGERKTERCGMCIAFTYYVFGDEIMIYERKSALGVVQKQKGCVFRLRFVLANQDGTWKNVLAVFKLVKKSSTRAVTFNYGDFVLGERFISIREAPSLFSDSTLPKLEFPIPGYDDFPIQSMGQWTFSPSRYKFGYIRDEFPIRVRELRVDQSRMYQQWNQELVAKGLPYYPNLNDACVDFLELSSENIGQYGTIYTVIPDYRARIETLKLSLSKVEVKISHPEIHLKDLILKVFAKSGLTMLSLPEIAPKSELIKFELDFQPDSLSVVLMSRKDNMRIDGKEFSKWTGQSESVIIERPQEEILSLARAGESQNLEYKYDVIEDKQRNDFIESVVAFLNSNRGIILVGVADSGDIVGAHTNRDDLQKMIHDSCDPPPVGVKIEQEEIEGKRLIIVEITEGSDKPYQSKRDKNWYVRHNANDMKMERSELNRFLQERTQVRSFV
jgi:hypothetical protein